MSTSIKVHRSLTIDLFRIDEEGVVTEFSFRFSRLQAQKVAETLRAFATGTSTKEVGTGTSALFIAENARALPAKADPAVRQVVRLR